MREVIQPMSMHIAIQIDQSRITINYNCMLLSQRNKDWATQSLTTMDGQASQAISLSNRQTTKPSIQRILSTQHYVIA